MPPLGRRKKRTRISVKHSVGAATLLSGIQKRSSSELQRTRLIHILAKHETPMNASKTVFGRVPAMLRTLVMRRRSIAVLLRADAIVNPPISNMMVGENMAEKMYLAPMRLGWTQYKSGYLLGGFGGCQTNDSAVLAYTPYYAQTNQKQRYEY